MMPRYLIPLRKAFMMCVAVVSVLFCMIAKRGAQNIQFPQGNVGSGMDNSLLIPLTSDRGEAGRACRSLSTIRRR